MATKLYVSFILLSLDKQPRSSEKEWSCRKNNLKGLKGKVYVARKE